MCLYNLGRLARCESLLKKSSLVCLMGAASMTFAPNAEGSTAWVSHYVGPAADEDVPTAIVVGDDAHTTVAGTSIGLGADFDYVVVQYDFGGAALWTSRYDGGLGDDAANDVEVGADLSVVVTGASLGADSTDYATVKYDPSGGEVWTARYAGPGGMDEAVAVEIDDDGNIYVTGPSQGASGSIEIATVKYDEAGTELWSKRFTAGVGSIHAVRDLVLAPNGDAIVVASTGDESDETGASYDYLILRYAPDSTLLWSTTYDGPDGIYDEAQAGAIDASGNIYVTGVSDANASGLDYATIKLTSAGALDWAVRHDGPAGVDDVAYSIAVDGSNVVVTGSSVDGSTDSDFATICYDTAGAVVWTATYDGPSSKEDVAYDVSLGENGIAYVTGSSWAGDGEVSTGIATVRYSATGSVDWVERYDVDDSTVVEPSAIAVDLFGNAFVAGTAHDVDEGLDFLTLAYIEDAAGAPGGPDEVGVYLPTHLALSQNVPNPVVYGTRIDLALPTNGRVDLRVYDVSGRTIATLLDREEAAGYHHIQWDASGLPGGTYFYRLDFDGQVQTRKMVVLE